MHLHFTLHLSLSYTQSCQFLVSLLDGFLGGQAKAKLSHMSAGNAKPPERCPGTNAALTSARRSEHTANVVSKLSFWQEHEVICLRCTSFLLPYLSTSLQIWLSFLLLFPQQTVSLVQIYTYLIWNWKRAHLSDFFAYWLIADWW